MTDVSVPQVPQIGFGHVWHQRLRPTLHAFRYGSYFFMLPLRSLRERPDGRLVRNRLSWLSFHDADQSGLNRDEVFEFDRVLPRPEAEMESRRERVGLNASLAPKKK